MSQTLKDRRAGCKVAWHIFTKPLLMFRILPDQHYNDSPCLSWWINNRGRDSEYQAQWRRESMVWNFIIHWFRIIQGSYNWFTDRKANKQLCTKRLGKVLSKQDWQLAKLSLSEGGRGLLIDLKAEGRGRFSLHFYFAHTCIFVFHNV
jgi:hypothetical protein